MLERFEAAEQERKMAERKALLAEWKKEAQEMNARAHALAQKEASQLRNSGMTFEGEDRFEPERRRWVIAHTCIHTCMHAFIHTYICTYMHTYVRAYIHTYVHTYIHTYAHTYIHTHTHA